MRVFLSTTCVSVFLILRRIMQDTTINAQVFTYSTRHSCQILMKLTFSSQTSEKYSNIKFHDNRLVGAKFFHADG
jgi:hypothetical protein